MLTLSRFIPLADVAVWARSQSRWQGVALAVALAVAESPRASWMPQPDVAPLARLPIVLTNMQPGGSLCNY